MASAEKMEFFVFFGRIWPLYGQNLATEPPRTSGSNGANANEKVFVGNAEKIRVRYFFRFVLWKWRGEKH
jgi:hypothetical protein